MCKTFHEKIFEKMHFFSKTGAPYSIYFLPTKYIFTHPFIHVHLRLHTSSPVPS